jgi:hypothetical protein
MPLKQVLSIMDLVNHYRIPKLLAIAHENDPKTQKRRVFGHASQICTKCHGPCKSLWNLKTRDFYFRAPGSLVVLSFP